ncbi:MAG: hypothetical protein KIG81_07285, partial [Thermoguttaceae bacterium]|nr:hypothetical protein [Thermoguttaceae bacterium]
SVPLPSCARYPTRPSTSTPTPQVFWIENKRPYARPVTLRQNEKRPFLSAVKALAGTVFFLS